jgi:DNA invertase Pin-like site-specific DNA recombinase
MRCAVYTRKSSEEGLAQEFNSLDAQRESGEAYILSQPHAGWTLLVDRYDDGGYTGANLERPRLRRLLADIEASKVDCVVIYKVDRLSRSLLDFARLMGTFEERGINLVSVTQQFNTTASLGRLTLNILLSFAQFERELIAERTRDKMSVARRKGKWVGGTPVLGYDIAPGGGRLIINKEESAHVRAIFALYVEHGHANPVLDVIQEQKWNTKSWIARNGRPHPGKPFTRADLMRLLTNIVYAGGVRSHGQTYPGEQPAIVEEKVWQRVQAMVQRGRAIEAETRAKRKRLAEPTIQIGATAPRLPRITRLLALAVKFEGLVQQGVIKDYTELARLGQISRPRVTQIMNLLNLAPAIQEQILSWARNDTDQYRSIRESTVRELSSEANWSRQRTRWDEILQRAPHTAR